MTRRLNPFRFSLVVRILVLFLPTTFAAEFKPAPQEFRQEVSQPLPLPAGISANGFTVLDRAPDGTVLVTDGKRWHAVRSNRLEVLPAPPNTKDGAGWIISGGIAREVPVPFSGIRQI